MTNCRATIYRVVFYIGYILFWCLVEGEETNDHYRDKAEVSLLAQIEIIPLIGKGKMQDLTLHPFS